MSSDSKFYAVKVGHQPGIYTSWTECKNNVDGFQNPTFRKFSTLEEAQTFMTNSYVRKSSSAGKSSNNAGKSSNGPKKYVNTDKYLGKYQNLIESKPYLSEIPYTIEKWNKFKDELFIFTDGSYKNNGKELNSGFAVFLGKDCINVKENM